MLILAEQLSRFQFARYGVRILVHLVEKSECRLRTFRRCGIGLWIQQCGGRCSFLTSELEQENEYFCQQHGREIVLFGRWKGGLPFQQCGLLVV